MSRLRIVYYVNQFFGGIGGEDKADIGPLVKEGPLGPGRVAQQALGEKGEIVATVICGDNYFSEDIAKATEEVLSLVEPFRPDAVVAGPAFFAGRYAVACGAVCKGAKAKFGVPAVTGMYRENPAVDLYSKDVFIVETGQNAKELALVVPKMVDLAVRLAHGVKIGRPSDEGYFPRGILINEKRERSSAERLVSMILSKVKGAPFVTEVPLPDYDPVPPARCVKDLRSATIAIVTDGGLVPQGNPDRIEHQRSTKYGRYSIEGLQQLAPGEYIAYHAGYTPVFVDQEPHRLVPLDVMRDLEAEGVIGKVYDAFFSTSGCASILENVKKMGRSIAEELNAKGVQAAILTST
jgi:glycine reductase complex component B subunit gamma